MNARLAAAAAVLALVAAAPAFAQDATGSPAGPTLDTSGDRITIGVGVASVPSYEGSDNNNFIPAGAIQGTISGYAFSTNGTRLYVDVIRNQPGPVVDFQLGPVIGVNLDRNRVKTIDDAAVERLGDRKIAIEAGGYIGIGKTGVITSDYDKLSASVAYVNDVNDAHHSYAITPQLDYGTPLSTKAYVGLSLSANYVGGGYADTYFGVTPAGTLASGLPTFNPDKGWKNYSVSALLNYSLTGDLLHGLGLGIGGSYSRLLGDFKDSPIVSLRGDKDQLYGFVGLTYTF